MLLASVTTRSRGWSLRHQLRLIIPIDQLDFTSITAMATGSRRLFLRDKSSSGAGFLASRVPIAIARFEVTSPRTNARKISVGQSATKLRTVEKLLMAFAGPEHQAVDTAQNNQKGTPPHRGV